MKKLAAIVVVAVLAYATPAAANIVSKQPDCNKKCQQSNDRWITDYTDYFVNDSDGSTQDKKDSVFTVYHRVPIGEKRCEVVKTYENKGVAITVVCP